MFKMLGFLMFRNNYILMLILMFLVRLFSGSTAISPIMYKNVCLGGTFDGIHAGHKLLFCEATKICKNKLVVGVTDANMITKKTLWELIAPVDERIQKVKEYLTEIDPNLTYHVVAINDIYGPTVVEKDLDCIVVSQETVRGADRINEKRREMGWPELKIKIVNLLEDTNSTHQESMSRLKENKISSSLLRFEKLGTIIKPPNPVDSIPNRPYLIGLTGGIASGKSSIAKYLQETHGFGYISYDLMGHRTYSEVGSPIYNKVVDFFGDNILNEETKAIDRGKLGKIVFDDKSKLDKLNEIVWPGIFALVDAEIEKIKHNHDVIVLESALLIAFSQTRKVHQLWTSIVPPYEAVKRLMESRNLTKEDAEKRVSVQTDNLTRVRASNAVFCSLWEEEITRKQVDKCVGELRNKYLQIYVCVSYNLLIEPTPTIGTS